MKTLGQTIRHYRKAKKISVIKLAEALGVTRAAVYQWERDETEIKFSHLIEISRILHVSLAIFAAAIEGRPSIDAEMADLRKDHKELLSRSFLDRIADAKKLQ